MTLETLRPKISDRQDAPHALGDSVSPTVGPNPGLNAAILHIISGDDHSECSMCDGSDCPGGCDIANIADVEDGVRPDSSVESISGQCEPLPALEGPCISQAASERVEQEGGLRSEGSTRGIAREPTRGFLAVNNFVLNINLLLTQR